MGRVLRPGKPGDIAVAGGGIGGALAALVLARLNKNIHLFEAGSKLEELSYGLQLTPNASEILVALGFQGALEREGCPIKSVNIYRADGRLLREIAVPQPYFAISRQSLMAAIAGELAALDQVALHLSEAVLSAEYGGGSGGLWLKTGSGKDFAAEALVMASGIGGRELGGFLPVPPRQDTGKAAFRCKVADHGAWKHGGATSLYLGERAHAVIYPIEAGRATNCVVITEQSAHDRPDLDQALPPDVQLALDLPRANWRKWPLLMKASGSWRAGQGPATLLGDCAHGMAPFLAQGAAMAIEDASMLGRALAKHETCEEAFRDYERARMPRCQKVQAASLRQGSAYHLDPRLHFIRNRVISWLPEPLLQRRTQWLFAPKSSA